jgi:pyridinium-3,5-biscarboxylic acid mononucleotide sulfurtransferase
MPDAALLAKHEQLAGRLRDIGPVVVGFSGGADSALLAYVAAMELTAARAPAVTAVSPSLAPEELADCAALASEWGLDWRTIETDELEDPAYAANDLSRCAHCKTALMDALENVAPVATVVLGVNVDDLGDHRPGLDAAKNAAVRSVLVDLGFTKDDVRQAAHLIGLAVWDKPASACLSSRIPYGTEVTRERLAQIGGLEAELRSLGLRQLRVRWHAAGASGAMARIEVARDELARAFEVRDDIVKAGKRFGFAFVTLDLQGYRTGSHNEVIVGKSLRVV